MTNAVADAIDRVALSCRVLGSLKLTHGALGHVSCRLDAGETMLIKAKGPGESGLRYTEARDIIEVDFDVIKVRGPEELWPPGETYIHSWLYRTRPEVNCVIHMHPEHAVLLTICEKEIYPIYGAYWPVATKMAIDGLDTFPYSLVVTNDLLGRQFAEFVGSKDAALMYGHGVTVVGTSIEDASVRAIALNQLVTMMYKAYVIGIPKRLPEEAVLELSRGRDPSSTTGSAVGDAGTLATWRYYVQLAGQDVPR